MFKIYKFILHKGGNRQEQKNPRLLKKINSSLYFEHKKMSSLLVYDTHEDGSFVQVIGVKATLLTQDEIALRAAAHIQSKLLPIERKYLEKHLDLPIPIPIVPYDRMMTKAGVLKLKARSVADQLNDDHLGTTNFRTQCQTCPGLDIHSCRGEHSSYHELPWPIGPITVAQTAVLVARSVCFACFRFVSKKYDDVLSSTPIMDFTGIRQTMDQKGKFQGGRIAIENGDEGIRRWNQFLLLQKTETKVMFKIAASRCLNAMECQHCGVIQPVSIDLKDDRVSAKWNLECIINDNGMWKPSHIFWKKLMRILMQTSCSNENHHHSQTCNHSIDEEEVWSSLNAYQWLGERIIAISMKRSSQLSADEVWALKVWPFVLGDDTILKNTIGSLFTFANIRQIFTYMRHEDQYRVGKTPFHDHLKELIIVNFFIPDKSIRPTIQDTSGGNVSANDHMTADLDKIVQSSSKVRAIIMTHTHIALDSWARFCKIPREELVKRVFSNNDVFKLYDYVGDVRMGYLDIVDDFGTKLSNLQYEISSTYDHTLAKDAVQKDHNSALKGAKTAKLMARMTLKMGRRAEDDDENDALLEGTCVDKKFARKRKQTKPIRKDKESTQQCGHTSNSDNLVEATFNPYQLFCPCSLFKTNSNDASTSSRIVRFDDDQYCISSNLQESIWIKMLQSFLLSWCTDIVAVHAPTSSVNPVQIHCTNDNFRISMVAKRRDDLNGILDIVEPLDENGNHIINHNISSSENISHQQHVRSRQNLTAHRKLPDPEQFKSVGYTGGPSKKPRTAKTLEGRLGGKRGRLRNNVTTKRVNRSVRAVLTPCTRMPLDCVGVPFRVCLNQTKPVTVTSANHRDISIRLGRARYYASKGWMADLGGVDSIVTNEGTPIFVNACLSQDEDMFSDEVFADHMRQKGMKENYISDEVILDQWAAPLQIGWTAYLYLENGDQVILSRPPILHRPNHNAQRLIAVFGFCFLLNTCSMPGYNADADGDAMMLTIMQAASARCSIRFLMSFESNMMDPRTHSIINGLKQDALLGCSLLMSESDSVTLDKRRAMTLISALKKACPLRSRSSCHKGLHPFVTRSNDRRSKNIHLLDSDRNVDPKMSHGLSWEVVHQKSKNPTHNEWTLPPPFKRSSSGKPYWTGRQLFDMTLPNDFCYVQHLDGCKMSATDVQSFIIDTVIPMFVNDEGYPLLEKSKHPDGLFIIWNGRWICGIPNSKTLSTAPNGITETLWRHYGKHLACDWVSNVSNMAQTYISEIRGFTCAFEDVIIGARDDYASALVSHCSQQESDKPVRIIEKVSKKSIDGSKRLEKPQIPKDGVSKNVVANTKLESMMLLETKRKDAFSYVSSMYDVVNQFLDDNASKLTQADVSEVYEKLDEYCTWMIIYGANMAAAHNALSSQRQNNVTIMAKVGSKGDSTNTGTMTATVGVARMKTSVAVGSNILNNTRNFASEQIGERSPSSLGFMDRGFSLGLTGKQFFQAAKEARQKIKNSSSPEKSGYLQTQVGVNSQSVSVHYDGTVRNQLDEIVQFNSNGDGYDACKIKSVVIKPYMIRAAESKQIDVDSKLQLESLMKIVFQTYAGTIQSDFASVETLKSKGLKFLLNVDVPGIFTLHAGRWKTNQKDAVSSDTICRAFAELIRSILKFDPSIFLAPYDLLLAIRLQILPSISPLMSKCSESDLSALLQDYYLTYCENMSDPGEAVGALACQSVNQPTTQLIMKSFKAEYGDVKQMLHMSSGLPRLSEVLGFTDSKTSLANIVLSPHWVSNEVEARFVATQFCSVYLKDWIEDGSGSICTVDGLFGQVDASSNVKTSDAIDRIRCKIEHAYSTYTEKPASQDVVVWKVKSSFKSLPSVAEYLSLFKHKNPNSNRSNDHIVAIEYITRIWNRCLLPTQFGGVVLESDSNGVGEFFFWVAFRHDARELSNLGMTRRQSNQNVTSKSIALSDWNFYLYSFMRDLPTQLVLSGSADVGSLLACVPPTSSPEVIEKFKSDCQVQNVLPDIAHCWKIQMRSKYLAIFMKHSCVVDQLCYTSNLKEIRDVFGIEATSQCLAVEASRVLTEGGSVYVQPRHTQLMGDVMTSEGDVLAMNQNGLRRKTRTSYLGQLSFEHISDNLIRSGLESRYDTLHHVVPNIMLGKRAPFIGSGICRAICVPMSQPGVEGQKKSHHDEIYEKREEHTPSTISSSIRFSSVASFETMEIIDNECDYRNLVDFMLQSSFG